MSTPLTSTTLYTHPYHLNGFMPSPSSLGNPLTVEVGQHIQKWIICKVHLIYTNFALRWDPIHFEDNKHPQKYEETNGSTSYLKPNTVKQLVNLNMYMILIIFQDRPAGQNYNPFHSILRDDCSN